MDRNWNNGRADGAASAEGGSSLRVYNRSPEKARKLIADGADVAANPVKAAKDAEVVFIMVPDTPDVESVAAKIEAVANGDQLIIDMSTIAPMAERAIAARMRAKGAEYLDAPVSGGETGAIEGTLTIMVGGAVAAFDRARPLLEALGKRITYMGESGAGQVTKLANQIAVALSLEAAAEALLFARKGGLDPARVLDAIGAGSAASWQLSNLGPKIIAHDYRPGFFVKLIRAAASVTSRKSLRGAKQWLEHRGHHSQTRQRQSVPDHDLDGTQALGDALEKLEDKDLK